MSHLPPPPPRAPFPLPLAFPLTLVRRQEDALRIAMRQVQQLPKEYHSPRVWSDGAGTDSGRTKVCFSLVSFSHSSASIAFVIFAPIFNRSSHNPTPQEIVDLQGELMRKDKEIAALRAGAGFF